MRREYHVEMEIAGLAQDSAALHVHRAGYGGGMVREFHKNRAHGARNQCRWRIQPQAAENLQPMVGDFGMRRP